MNIYYVDVQNPGISNRRRAIPEARRYGSTFVFREGSPLVPEDLQKVSAQV